MVPKHSAVWTCTAGVLSGVYTPVIGQCKSRLTPAVAGSHQPAPNTYFLLHHLQGKWQSHELTLLEVANPEVPPPVPWISLLEELHLGEHFHSVTSGEKLTLSQCVPEWCHALTSRHVTSRHVTSRHVTSRHVTSRHATPQHNTHTHTHTPHHNNMSTCHPIHNLLKY